MRGGDAWVSLGMCGKIADAMKRLGYSAPTKVQAAAIPKVLSGRHTLIVAPTGSGKTEAALLPILSRMVCSGRKFKPIVALYITPLRALNRDMFRRFEQLAGVVGIKVAIRHGDTPSRLRKEIVRSPPHILITTPETLAIMLVNEGMRRWLRNVRWVVIDEFHEILSSKRGAHLLADLERLRKLAGPYQRIALSASIGNPYDAAEALAPGKLVNVVVTSSSREAEIIVEFIPQARRDELAAAIAEKVVKHGKVLVFTNTRDEAEALGSILQTHILRKGLGIKVAVHHGSLAKQVRKSVEDGLKHGSINAVICTSSLELGIDIGDVNAVIQVGSPKQVTKLLQRVGRSRHRAGSKAVGYVIVRGSVSEALESIVIARRAVSGDVEPARCIRKPLDVLLHVIVGMGLESDGFTLEDALDTLTKSYPFMNLTESELLKIVELSRRLRYLKFEGGRFKTTGRGRLYYLRTTMIVDTPRYDVIDLTTSRKIGYFDEDFIVSLIDSSAENRSVVLSGRVWRVVGISDSDRKVYVEPPESLTQASIPFWRGESIPVEYKVAREACALRRLLALNYVPDPVRQVSNEDTLELIRHLIRRHVESGYPLPSEKVAVVEIVNGGEGVVIHACLGSRGNKGLAILLSYMLSRYLGRGVGFGITPYSVMLQVGRIGYAASDSGANTLRRFISAVLKDAGSMARLDEALRDTSTYRLAVSKVLRRMGIIPQDASSEVVKVLVRRFADDELVSREALNEVFFRVVDRDALEKFLKGLRDGSISLRFVEVSKQSPLATDLLVMAGGILPGVARGGVLPEGVVAELLKRRILSKKVSLICMLCGRVWEAEISALPQRIKCPACGSGLVAPYFGKDVGRVADIARRGMRAGRRYKFVLNGDERRVFEELLDSAKLVLDYGRQAVEALAVRGIGPKSAAKVLGRLRGRDFYLELYRMERTYVRTRRFWKD